MTQIVISGAGTTPILRELKPGTVTIGRKSDNDVRLEDATVSGHHAKIVSYFQSSHIEDLNSTNGTYVNGRRVRMHTLHPGDVVAIGKFELRFGVDAKPAAPPPPVSGATMVMVRKDFNPPPAAPVKPNPPASAALTPKPPSPAVSPPAAPIANRHREQAVLIEPAAAPAKTPSVAAAAPPAAQAPQPSAQPAPAAPVEAARSSAFFQVMVGERAGQRLPIQDDDSQPVPGVRIRRQGSGYLLCRCAEPDGQRVRLNSREVPADGVLLKDMDMLQVDSMWMAFFSR